MIYFVTTLSVALVILFLLLFFTLKNGISPMPTSHKVRKFLFSHLPELKDGLVVDLGSGWGNLVFPLSKKYKNCEVIGYENSPIPYFFSSLLNHAPNVTIKRENFLDRPLNEADLVVCYLFPKGMEKLKSKLEKELKTGSQVVSHTFAVPGWQPTKVIEADDLHYTKIYFYQR